MLRIILAMFCLYLVTDKANCQTKQQSVETTADGRFIFVERTVLIGPDSSISFSGWQSGPLTKAQLQPILDQQQQRVNMAEAEIDSSKARALRERKRLKDLEKQIGRANRDVSGPPQAIPNATGETLESMLRDVPIPTDDIPEVATKYKVVYVYDGDTYYVQVGSGMQRVRPVGFDCDEVQGKYMRQSQYFGDIARDTIRKMLVGDSIELDIKGFDRYGRTLAQVKWRGQDMAILMLRNGWADYLTSSHLGPNTRKAYQKERDAAKRARRGRWNGNNIVTPRTHREKYQIK